MKKYSLTFAVIIGLVLVFNFIMCFEKIVTGNLVAYSDNDLLIKTIDKYKNDEIKLPPKYELPKEDLKDDNPNNDETPPIDDSEPSLGEETPKEENQSNYILDHISIKVIDVKNFDINGETISFAKEKITNLDSGSFMVEADDKIFEYNFDKSQTDQANTYIFIADSNFFKTDKENQITLIANLNFKKFNNITGKFAAVENDKSKFVQIISYTDSDNSFCFKFVNSVMFGAITVEISLVFNIIS